MPSIDRERFDRCWSEAHPAIAGFVAALAPDAHVADDLMQDIALAALRLFAQYDPSRPFIAWAMGIARTQLLTMRRDRARAATRLKQGVVESLAEVWQELQPELDERHAALRECLQSVGGRRRELVELRYLQALGAEEIGRRLGLAADAVRQALSRTRAALHACIERRLARTGSR
jgi:RNA polymerase sigma-70 factor (ECF subfamily)